MPLKLHERLQIIEKKHSKSVILGIEHLRRVAKDLDVTNLPGKTIIVAGTNGKGSCIAVMRDCLMAAGYNVGCYTSPHLWSFNERLTINSESVTDNVWCNSFDKLEMCHALEHATYFEYVTLAALLILKESKLDYYLLEIGLGGRKDAVNLVASDAAVITSVSLDHCAMLGNTRYAIAKEKSGVIKQNNCFAVCGDSIPPDVIANAADANGVKLWQINRNFSINKKDNSWDLNIENTTYKNLPTQNFPESNAACAIVALQSLGVEFTNKTLANTLDNVQIIGRWQKVISNRKYWFDVGHNPACAEFIAEKIKILKQKRIDVYIIFAVTRGKELEGIIKPLIKIIHKWLCIEIDDSTYSCNELKKRIKKLSNKAEAIMFKKPSAAVEYVAQNTKVEDNIIVFGSFKTVAAIMPLVQTVSV